MAMKTRKSRVSYSGSSSSSTGSSVSSSLKSKTRSQWYSCKYCPQIFLGFLAGQRHIKKVHGTIKGSGPSEITNTQVKVRMHRLKECQIVNHNNNNNNNSNNNDEIRPERSKSPSSLSPSKMPLPLPLNVQSSKETVNVIEDLQLHCQQLNANNTTSSETMDDHVQDLQESNKQPFDSIQINSSTIDIEDSNSQISTESESDLSDSEVENYQQVIKPVTELCAASSTDFRLDLTVPVDVETADSEEINNTDTVTDQQQQQPPQPIDQEQANTITTYNNQSLIQAVAEVSIPIQAAIPVAVADTEISCFSIEDFNIQDIDLEFFNNKFNEPFAQEAPIFISTSTTAEGEGEYDISNEIQFYEETVKTTPSSTEATHPAIINPTQSSIQMNNSNNNNNVSNSLRQDNENDGGPSDNNFPLESSTLKDLQCKICLKQLTTKSGLIYHLENTHLDKLFSCDLCNVKYRTRTAFETHCGRTKHKNNARKMPMIRMKHNNNNNKVSSNSRMQYSSNGSSSADASASASLGATNLVTQIKHHRQESQEPEVLNVNGAKKVRKHKRKKIIDLDEVNSGGEGTRYSITEKQMMGPSNTEVVVNDASVKKKVRGGRPPTKIKRGRGRPPKQHPIDTMSQLPSRALPQQVDEPASLPETTNTPLWTCRLCEASFDDVFSLLQHTRALHQRPQVPVSKQKKKKVKVKTPSRPPSSQVVPESTSTSSSSSQVPAAYFECEFCKKSFGNERGYKIHVARLHKLKPKAKTTTTNAEVQAYTEVQQAILTIVPIIPPPEPEENQRVAVPMKNLAYEMSYKELMVTDEEDCNSGTDEYDSEIEEDEISQGIAQIKLT